MEEHCPVTPLTQLSGLAERATTHPDKGSHGLNQCATSHTSCLEPVNSLQSVLFAGLLERKSKLEQQTPTLCRTCSIYKNAQRITCNQDSFTEMAHSYSPDEKASSTFYPTVRN